MKPLSLGGSILSSRIGYGCMPLGGTWDKSPASDIPIPKAVAALRAAFDGGITLFDHADIYCMGKSELIFARALAELKTKREKILLQSKVGIRFGGDPKPDSPQRYDFSSDHITSSVEGSLRRLGTDYLDLYLLHRPDILVEPAEVAQAFDHLHKSGKVRAFGVSNHNREQIELLKKHLRQPILVNQVELSLVHSHLLEAGVVTNQNKVSYGADGTLDYCRLQNITIQAWGPVASGRAVGGTDSPKSIELANIVSGIAKKKGVSNEAIAISWLLRHPAGIQPILGSTNPARIKAMCLADEVDMSREEWYTLFTAGRGAGLP